MSTAESQPATATTESQPKTAIEHFDKAADKYEKYTGGCTREIAQHLLDRLPERADAGTPGSVVLDNACGTAIMAEEIMRRQSGAASIHAVDAAPNMVDIAQRKLDGPNERRRFAITCRVMPAEQLEFDDDTFTHSITNFGILFFKDAVMGAKEIHRTLRAGGIAVVTSWTDLGYLEPVVQAAQLEIRPEQNPYQLPLAPERLTASHLESVLSLGGFRTVKVAEMKAHYGAETVEAVAELLAYSFRDECKDWSKEEKDRLSVSMQQKTARIAEEYTMPNGQKGIGIPMMAAVAIARK